MFRRFFARFAQLGACTALATGCLESRSAPTSESDVRRCTACHGDPNRSGDYLARAAPPFDLAGASTPSYPGVGAHAIHLTASDTHAAFACTECHVVPTQSNTPGHGDHGSPATLVFGPIARINQHAPHYDTDTRRCSDSYCHGASTAASNAIWNEPRSSDQACGSCHGLPPALPHPQGDRCSECHGQVLDAARRFIAPELHVNGRVEVAVPEDCSSCHGSALNPAPPRDLDGLELTSSASVGAHQTHVIGTGHSRAVPCAECHLVPKNALDPGHLDSARPAEVIFSGAALAFDASPRYENGSCQNTACHGAHFASDHDSGGTNTAPSWTRVDGTQASCGTCHGLPPPPPHPYAALNPVCSACHEDIAADNQTFVRPELHADGIVTFSVP